MRFQITYSPIFIVLIKIIMSQITINVSLRRRVMQSIKKQAFVKSLESVKKGIANRELIEQSASFIFRKNKIIAYNDEIFAMTNSELELEGAIVAEPLLKLLNKIKDDEIQVSCSDSELTIKGKKFSSGIMFDAEIKVPIDEVKLPKKMQKLPDGFSSAVRLACLTAGRSLHEPILTCVHIFNNKVESCDNERITICELETEFDFDVLVPAKPLLSLCSEKLIEVAVDDAWIHFKTDDGTILSTRLFNEKFVDLQQFIPEEIDGHEITFPKHIAEILTRADIFSKDITSQEKMISLAFNDKKMLIEAKNDKGWFKEKAVVDFKDNLAFSINLEFLQDILKITNKISVINNSLFFETENSIHLLQLDNEEE